jgi:tetraacyldisaccharide 4'-kinase
MELVVTELVSLKNKRRVPLAEFSEKQVHALAGIGSPGRFFHDLEKAGFDVIEHPFPDHYVYQQQDILFGDDKPVLMTEKDAVKVEHLQVDNHWYVPAVAQLDERFITRLMMMVKKLDQQTQQQKVE